MNTNTGTRQTVDHSRSIVTFPGQGSRVHRHGPANPNVSESPGHSAYSDEHPETAASVGFVLVAFLAWIIVSLAVVGWLTTNRGLVAGIAFGPPLLAFSAICWSGCFYRAKQLRVRATLWWAAFALLPSILALQVVGVL